MDKALIKTIIVVMMENRSFDNLLGYLSLPDCGRSDVEGLGKGENWETTFASKYEGNAYLPFPIEDPYDPIDADPPHERGPIALQMGVPVDGVFPMDGFVTNYANAPGAHRPVPGGQPPVMGYYTKEHAPVTAFLAENFAICDHWFSSLPAGTQPNRLMAMSGTTQIDVNTVPLPEQELVYDWLDQRGINWRSYHVELPFYAMMLSRIPAILGGGRFRKFEEFLGSASADAPDDYPNMIFVEPAYTDAPHIGPGSDDHAPSAILGGQQFLLEVYRAATADPDKWKNTVMIVTYDEHGGFFDHVSPPALRTDPPPGASYAPFETLGVRVPAFVVSPFVRPGSVFSGRLDHTSILKFIGEVFDPDGHYSDIVDNRAVGSVMDVLEDASPVEEAPVINSLEDYLRQEAPKVGYIPGAQPSNALQQAFKRALDQIRQHPSTAQSAFAELLARFA